MSRKYRKKQSLPKDPVIVDIDSLSHEGRGVARLDGKIVFVDGALPDEKVEMLYTFQRGKFDEGRVYKVIQPSKHRVEPPCEYFSVCGGCSLQHISNQTQIEHKQSILKEQLQHFAEVQPESWLPPLQGDTLGYRRKARLGVRYVHKKQRTLIGFREKYSSFLADIEVCKVLTERVSKLILPMSELINTLEIRESIPQIEVSSGDKESAFIVRHLKPIGESDRTKWLDFAQQHDIQLYFQSKGPNTVIRVWPPLEEEVLKEVEPLDGAINDSKLNSLEYELKDFAIKFKHSPLDFVQVNASINQKMVSLAIELLDVKPDDRILDLFCGLGNFTLPLATRASFVVGVEGVQDMVERGIENAKLNQLDNVEFYQADLTADLSQMEWNQRQFNKILIDPARSGALEVINNIIRFNAEKIVYVSCNPATLARDTGELIKSGYKLLKAGVLDMFPHTTHVESIALFEKV